MMLIAAKIHHYLEIDMINLATDDPQLLNEDCGAEYVHKEGKLPSNASAITSPEKGACFDGDADRLIYYQRKGATPIVIDGDK